MAMEVRRVVTGHDENGKATVVSDERMTAVPRIGVEPRLAAGVSNCEMWSTDRMPVDNSAVADAAQRTGFVKHYIHANYIGTGAGTTFRITEFAPGHARFTHRTKTADYVVVLSGEIDMELENDEVVHLKQGDVVATRDGPHLDQRGLRPSLRGIYLDRCHPRRGRWAATTRPLSSLSDGSPSQSARIQSRRDIAVRG
jgi:mannose-6-phosphate isomerase-like protein (cupin superfamily)